MATKEFTVNIISEHFIEAANSTSIEAPSNVNEWLVSGLTMEHSVSFYFLYFTLLKLVAVAGQTRMRQRKPRKHGVPGKSSHPPHVSPSH